MTYLLVAIAATFFSAGASMLMAGITAHRGPSLVQRLGPYTPRGDQLQARRHREILIDELMKVAESLARGLGVKTSLSVRLARAGRSITPERFRLGQAGTALACAVLAIGLLIFTELPGSLLVPAVALATAIGYLIAEQSLDSQAKKRTTRYRAEMPLLAEHLAILIGSGMSLSTAINTVSQRSRGLFATDLSNVAMRVNQGMSIEHALTEMARGYEYPELDRLTETLALHQNTSDLARLIAAQAESLRRANHRRLLAQIETRSQMIWIPVTVAALVPGSLLLAAPLLQAVKAISNL